ncbi:MAG: hypothetical protein JW955_20365 [Sedimentisphaerales bacterium]|nr:hypothetical protein [Sedimentisphaerales bacterium]
MSDYGIVWDHKTGATKTIMGGCRQYSKELKCLIVANRQFETVDDEADHAEHWLLGLRPITVLRKAGVLSGDFWLKDVL